MSNIVTCALALAKDTSGNVRYLYQGAVVPEDITPGEVERLSELHLIADPDHPLVVALNAGAIGVDGSATASGQVEFQGTDPGSVRLAERAEEKPAPRQNRR